MTHAAAGRTIERAEQMEQRALSRAARADDGDHLSPSDLQVDAVEHGDVPPSPPRVRLRQINRLEHRHSCRIASTGK